MAPRRPRGSRKKFGALGDFISAQLEQLGSLARDLNGEGWEDSEKWSESARSYARRLYDPKLVAAATEAIEATLSASSYPDISTEVAARFDALADGAGAWHYVANINRPDDAGQFLRASSSGVKMFRRSRTAQGMWVALLHDFLVNPQRDRLHRCPVCRRWFVDETRNKSAQRCSRKCTIAWSNLQRTTKRAVTERKRGAR